ncbi:DUF4176 domain-containing protein [Enterococcus faecalis]|uniref:DUF4176 domain-containing protein n=1 Tax=Enterococcus faecalis TaxID=1351 RepID=UPI0024331C03|nr:DUF4176 domain-containing protein [Enterococcus faecalis]
MNQQQKELWVTTLESSNLTEEITKDALNELGLILGGQPQLAKNVYQSFLNQATTYEHKPRIGVIIQISFDYGEESVTFDWLKKQVVLTVSQFKQFMRFIDTIFTEIYPIGTIVELDEELLTEDVRTLFTTDELGLFVSVQGRKLTIPETQMMIDYVGTVWPFGLQAEVDPIYFNSVMVKRVISQGPTNEYEEKFVFEVLRKQLLDEKKYSCTYL